MPSFKAVRVLRRPRSPASARPYEQEVARSSQAPPMRRIADSHRIFALGFGFFCNHPHWPLISKRASDTARATATLSIVSVQAARDSGAGRCITR